MSKNNEGWNKFSAGQYPKDHSYILLKEPGLTWPYSVRLYYTGSAAEIEKDIDLWKYCES